MREGERKGEGGRERGSERVSVCVCGGGGEEGGGNSITHRIQGLSPN